MILAAGLTPAWQRTMVFDAFRPGGVNRASEVHECAAGKVLNVAMALQALGAETRSLSFAGGETGKALQRELAAAGVDARWIETAVPTRTCTTILAGGGMTELVENAAPARPEELDAFAAAFGDAAKSVAAIVLSGSLPTGTPPTFYRDRIAQAEAPVVLDALGPELLEALEQKPFLVKPNRRELAATLGRDLPDESAFSAAISELHDRGARWVVVTDEDRPIRVSGDGQARTFEPRSAPTVNPIGCGDSMAAAIAVTLARGGDPIEGVRLGMAAALDNLGQVLPARIDAGRVKNHAAGISLH